jgi:hypothetical protein
MIFLQGTALLLARRLEISTQLSPVLPFLVEYPFSQNSDLFNKILSYGSVGCVFHVLTGAKAALLDDNFFVKMIRGELAEDILVEGCNMSLAWHLDIAMPL